MNFKRRLITGILLIIALAAGLQAQRSNTNGDRILAGGEYVLRQSDADRLAEFLEWLFAAQMTAPQRDKYLKLLVREWKNNETSARSLTELLGSYEKIKALGDAKREQFRLQLLPELIAELEKSDKEIDMFLLGVYRNSPNGNTSQNENTEDLPNGDSSVSGKNVRIADLAGVWSSSSVSGERYKSLVTGELSDPNGSIIEYQISPTGDIKHVGYLSSTVYSCTTKLFISRTGRISISGSNITFNFAPGKRIYQTCSASASRSDTLPAERKTLPFRIERSQAGLKLCTIEDGKDLCLYKKRG
jgi:hypothetical protein